MRTTGAKRAQDGTQVRPRRKSQRYNAPPPEERRNETKTQKFQRIIVPRINNALKDIGLLRTGADRTRYDISPRDLKRLEETLHGAVEDVIKAYKKPEPASPSEFSLTDIPSPPPEEG
ncbi:MAG: hypothetical protein KGL39_03425 [Patescibacteria group bacterium]|nr:hypothetical protein [Patescibacteria group bacterium]